MLDLTLAAKTLEDFCADSSLTGRIGQLQQVIEGTSASQIGGVLSAERIDESVLDSALTFKQIAGQINVVIHAVGILVSLPHVLEPGETIRYVSLGAGNTGKPFDLETDRRVA